MTEKIIESSEWPGAVFLSILVVAIASFLMFYLHEGRQERQQTIIEHCASAPDPEACAAKLNKALETVK